jgi:hypothetical protein
MYGLKPVPFTQIEVIGQALRARSEKPGADGNLLRESSTPPLESKEGSRLSSF